MDDLIHGVSEESIAKLKNIIGEASPQDDTEQKDGPEKIEVFVLTEEQIHELLQLAACANNNPGPLQEKQIDEIKRIDDEIYAIVRAMQSAKSKGDL